MPKFEEFAKQEKKKEEPDSFVMFNPELNTERSRDYTNEAISPFSYGSDQIDKLIQSFEDRVSDEESFAERTRYYFRSQEMTHAKMERYYAMSQDIKSSEAMAGKYGTHKAYKRRKAAGNAADYFKKAEELADNFEALGKNPLQIYEHREKIMRLRLNGRLEAAEAKAQSKEHEKYLKGKATLSTLMILKDQLVHLMQSEEVDKKLQKKFDKKLKNLNSEIDTAKKYVGQTAPSSIETWQRTQKDFRYPTNGPDLQNYVKRKNKENPKFRNEEAKLLNSFKYMSDQNAKWPARIVLKQYEGQPINKAEKAKADYNEKLNNILAGEDEEQKRAVLTEAMKRVENYKLPSLKDIEGEDLIKILSFRLTEYYEIMNIALPHLENASEGSFEKKYMEQSPLFVHKLRCLRAFSDYVNALLKYNHGIGVNSSGGYFVESSSKITDKDKMAFKNLRSTLVHAQKAYLETKKIADEAAPLGAEDSVNKTLSGEENKVEYKTSEEETSTEKTADETEAKEKTTEKRKESEGIDPSVEITELRQSNKNLTEDGYLYYKKIQNSKIFATKTYKNHVDTMLSRKGAYMGAEESPDELIRKNLTIIMPLLTMVDRKSKDKQSKRIDKNNRDIIEALGSKESMSLFVTSELPNIYSNFKMPTVEQIKAGWFEKTLKNDPNAFLDVIRKAAYMDDLIKEYPEAKNVFKDYSTFEPQHKAILRLGKMFAGYMKGNYGIDIGKGGTDVKVIPPVSEDELKEAKDQVVVDLDTYEELHQIYKRERDKILKNKEDEDYIKKEVAYTLLDEGKKKEKKKIQKINKGVAEGGLPLQLYEHARIRAQIFKNPVYKVYAERAKTKFKLSEEEHYKEKGDITLTGTLAPLMMDEDFNKEWEPIGYTDETKNLPHIHNLKWLRAWSEGDIDTIDEMCRENMDMIVNFDLPAPETLEKEFNHFSFATEETHINFVDEAVMMTSEGSYELIKKIKKFQGLPGLIKRVPCLQQYCKEHPEFEAKCQAAADLAEYVNAYMEDNYSVTVLPTETRDVAVHPKKEKSMAGSWDVVNAKNKFRHSYDKFFIKSLEKGGIEIKEKDSRTVPDFYANFRKISSDEVERTKEIQKLMREWEAEEEKLRLEKEKAEKEDKARLDKERAEKERTIREERERQEREKAEKERLEREKAEKEDKARLEKEKAEQEEKERLEKEKKEKERLEMEKADKERREREKAEKERQEREKAQEAEKLRLEKERAEQEEKERFEREKAEREEKERIKREERVHVYTNGKKETYYYKSASGKVITLEKKNPKNLKNAIALRRQVLNTADIDENPKLKPLFDHYDKYVKEHLKQEDLGKFLGKDALKKKDIKGLDHDQIQQLRLKLVSEGIIESDLQGEAKELYDYYDSAMKKLQNSERTMDERFEQHEKREEKEYDIVLDTNLLTEYESQASESNDCWSCAGSAVYNHFIRNEENYEELKADQRKFRNEEIKIKGQKEINLDNESYKIRKLEVEKFTKRNHSKYRKGSPMGDPYVVADFYLKRFKNMSGFENTAVRKMAFSPAVAVSHQKGVKMGNGEICKDTNALHNLTEKFKQTVAQAIGKDSVIAFLYQGHYYTIYGLQGDTLKVFDSTNYKKELSVKSVMNGGRSVRELVWLEKIEKPEDVTKEFSGVDYDDETGSFKLKENGSHQFTEEEIAHNEGVGVWKSLEDKSGDVADMVSEGIYLPKNFVKNRQSQSAPGGGPKAEEKTEENVNKINIINDEKNADGINVINEEKSVSSININKEKPKQVQRKKVTLKPEKEAEIQKRKKRLQDRNELFDDVGFKLLESYNNANKVYFNPVLTKKLKTAVKKKHIQKGNNASLDITRIPGALLRSVNYDTKFNPVSDEDYLNEQWNMEVMTAFETGDQKKIAEAITGEIPRIFSKIKLPVPTRKPGLTWFKKWFDNEVAPNPDKWFEAMRRHAALGNLVQANKTAKDVLESNKEIKEADTALTTLFSAVQVYMKLGYRIDAQKTGDEQVVKFEGKKKNPKAVTKQEIIANHKIEEENNALNKKLDDRLEKQLGSVLEAYGVSFGMMKEAVPDSSFVDTETLEDKHFRQAKARDPKLTENDYKIYLKAQRGLKPAKTDPKILDAYWKAEPHIIHQGGSSPDRDIAVMIKQVDYDEDYQPLTKQDEENLKYNLKWIEAFETENVDLRDDMLAEGIDTLLDGFVMMPEPTQEELDAMSTMNEKGYEGFKKKMEDYFEKVVNGDYTKFFKALQKTLAFDSLRRNNPSFELYLKNNPQIDKLSDLSGALNGIMEVHMMSKHHIAEGKLLDDKGDFTIEKRAVSLVPQLPQMYFSFALFYSEYKAVKDYVPVPFKKQKDFTDEDWAKIGKKKPQ